MSERNERMEITSTALLDSVRCSFEIALNALCQAATNCGIIGLNPTKREITEVIVDLRKAIDVIDNHKSNATHEPAREKGLHT